MRPSDSQYRYRRFKVIEHQNRHWKNENGLIQIWHGNDKFSNKWDAQLLGQNRVPHISKANHRNKANVTTQCVHAAYTYKMHLWFKQHLTINQINKINRQTYNVFTWN